MLLHYKNVLWIYSVTYCNMTSSRVWKTSMSIVLLWVSITAHKAESINQIAPASNLQQQLNTRVHHVLNGALLTVFKRWM